MITNLLGVDDATGPGSFIPVIRIAHVSVGDTVVDGGLPDRQPSPRTRSCWRGFRDERSRNPLRSSLGQPVFSMSLRFFNSRHPIRTSISKTSSFMWRTMGMEHFVSRRRRIKADGTPQPWLLRRPSPPTTYGDEGRWCYWYGSPDSGSEFYRV